MSTTLLINKPIGLSPLDVIKELKLNNPDLKDKKIGFAGRLDPMAEGLLLLLVGDENKEREKYLRLPKTYEIKILLGVETDSYDLLGRITRVSPNIQKDRQGSDPLAWIPDTMNTWFEDDAYITNNLKSFVGTFLQKYPPYSSPKIAGKSLFALARSGTLSAEDIPSKERTIFSISNTTTSHLSGKEIASYAIETITKVNGDFRQEECIGSWNDFVKDHSDSVFPLLACTVSCSSGTYMRSLAHDLGAKLGCSGLAYSIKRIKIGEYKISD
ncbi:MAG: hypothetical protein ACMG6E_01790 [Candidatus Roizmanbacteria bacterium]